MRGMSNTFAMLDASGFFKPDDREPVIVLGTPAGSGDLRPGMARLQYESRSGPVLVDVPQDRDGTVVLPSDAIGSINISYLPEKRTVLTHGGMFGWSNPVEKPKQGTKAKTSKAKAKAKFKMQKAARRKNRK